VIIGPGKAKTAFATKHLAIGDGTSSAFALADVTDRENRLTASDDPRIGAAAPGMRDA
jgi:hypothetical protein